MAKKYCAFGGLYYDMKGEVVRESENTVWIRYEGGWIEAWSRPFVKIFNTRKKRDKWIKDQDYRYDDR